MPLSQAQPLGAEHTTFSSSKPSSHTAYLLSGEQLQFIPQNSGQSIYIAAKLPFSLSTSIAMSFFGPCCIFLMFKLEAKKTQNKPNKYACSKCNHIKLFSLFFFIFFHLQVWWCCGWLIHVHSLAFFLFSSVQSNNFQRNVLNNFLISASSMDFP